MRAALLYFAQKPLLLVLKYYIISLQVFLGGKEVKRLSFMAELYIVMFAVLVLPLTAVMIGSSRAVFKYSEEEIALSASRNLSSVRTLNETVLQGIKTETLTLAKNPSLEKISGLKYLSPAIANMQNFLLLKDVEKLLYQMAYSNGKIYSVYFYVDGADYAISNREGIFSLDEFSDAEFIKDCAKEYAEKKYSVQGFWEARKIKTANGSVNAVSYVYPLSSLITTARGFIIVNLNESAFNDLINSYSLDQNGESFIIDTSGNVIIHGSTTDFQKNLSDNQSISRILTSSELSGSVISSQNDKNLYVFSKDTSRGWIYISRYSINSLFSKINSINESSFLLLIGITAAGLFVTFFITSRISKPMNALVKTLKSRGDLSLGDAKNEMVLISNAYRQILEQEKTLSEMVRQKEIKEKELFINDLLKGDFASTPENIEDVFPYPNFLAMAVSIDGAERFVSDYTPEQRHYFRIMVLEKCRTGFDGTFISKGVLHENHTAAIILNIKNYDCAETPLLITKTCQRLQAEIKNEFGFSVSFGIGGVHGSISGIKTSFSEAREAFKQKLLSGKESILFWKEQNSEGGKYFYPYNHEKHILNLLQARDFPPITEEIREISSEIRNSPGISYDNILQIYNQLVSTAIKFLVENNMNIREIFGNIHLVYRKMSALETLEEIDEYLISFFGKIEKYVSENTSADDVKHIDRILNYVKQHYKGDINFEDMAEEIGISYSYIRKIIKDFTGKNLIDYINGMRIDEAKRLLKQTDAPIAEIAGLVGYNNVQSLTRFFKKYEGITPGEYRNIKE